MGQDLERVAEATGRLVCIDLAEHGRRGVAVGWGDGAGGMVMGLVQVRSGRLSARLGFILADGPDPSAMVDGLLVPRQEDGVVMIGGADAVQAALDLVFCMRGTDALRLAVPRTPVTPETVEAVRSGHARVVGPWLARVLGDSPDWIAARLVATSFLPPEAASPLLGTGDVAGRLREMVSTHPVAALALLSQPDALSALSDGATVEDAFRAAFPGHAQGHLRRVRGIDPSAFDPILARRTDRQRRCVAAVAYALAARLPPAWMPGPGEWHDLATVALVIQDGYVLDEGCVSTSRGDWSGLVRRLRKVAGVAEEASPVEALDALCAHARNLGDASAALCMQLVLPLVAHGRMRRGAAHPLHGGGDLETPCLAVARDLLFDARGLPACFEVSQRWHRQQDALSRSFMSADADMVWPVPFGAVSVPTSGGEILVVPIGDALTLHEEGGAGPDRRGTPGLDHCVFGRLGGALRGDAHVLSLRRILADGRYERLSTAQIELGGLGFEVIEHQGRSNGPVPPECLEAIDHLARMHAATALDVMPRSAGRPDPIRDTCGYDWRSAAALSRALVAWEPFLPRKLRGLAPTEVAMILEARFGPSVEADRMAA